MKTFLLLISFICLNSYSQDNLVVNGSFEDYTSCPQENNLYQGEFEKCVGWWGAYMTPDFMNSCSFNPALVSVPQNFGGYQIPYEGNGYVHFAGHSWQKSNGNYSESEYIQTKLTKPLEPCKKYSISFYISVANWSTFNTQNISVAFSKDSSYYCDQGSNCTEKPLVDEVINFKLNMGADTLNWYKIDTNFTVSDTYQFLTIGDFKLTLEDTVYIQESVILPQYDYTFFYIDSIQMTFIEDVNNCEIDYLTVPNVFTPNNDQTNEYIDFSQFDKVIILNRWGTTILIMDSQSNFHWHGKNYKEEDVPDGVYFYMAYRGNYQQEGSIQLIR
ncbi:gliding motility-associated C-terminal domain-containing protein [Paracrocinitomix mangrovi]|uniref:T9SS type B sorting domain-containing protein n=1 Tax=Paracrocinitomix mangrovi TaxID=2862509 RepID=UPI001C8EA476|nr:gliding motility-associated C-terminal domain-containing protein [Paracrocinitomix mangrovi]UKN02513.1 gliding motility-associated C-terminal domain-containing protein [Paracrocinitomix mangrovi]